MIEPRHHTIICPNYKKPLCFGVGKHALHYMEWGDVDSPRVAVCVHGLTRNARDFDHLARALVEQGYRVIAVDVVGRGDSPNLKKPRYYSYPLYVADMVHLLKKRGLKQVDWIGTSMGGLMGMMIANAKPKLIGRMVLNDIGPLIVGKSLMRIGAAVGQNMLYATAEQAMAGLKVRMASFGIVADAHWQHVFDHGFVVQDDGGYRVKYDPHLADAFWNKRGKQRKMADMDVWKLWQKLDLPILALRGENSDLLLPETLAQMAEKPNVTAITFKDVGHAPMLMSDEQIAPVVAWLAE